MALVVLFGGIADFTERQCCV